MLYRASHWFTLKWLEQQIPSIVVDASGCMLTKGGFFCGVAVQNPQGSVAGSGADLSSADSERGRENETQSGLDG